MARLRAAAKASPTSTSSALPVSLSGMNHDDDDDDDDGGGGGGGGDGGTTVGIASVGAGEGTPAATPSRASPPAPPSFNTLKRCQ